MTLSAHVDLVNEQIRYHQEMLSRGSERVNSHKHRALVVRWEALREYLVSLSMEDSAGKPLAEAVEELPEWPTTAKRPSAAQAEFADLSDLPPELVKELGVTDTEQKDSQILEVIRDFGGEASITQILIGLYRKFKVIEKRRLLNSRLYSMVQRRGILAQVTGKKGYYKIAS